MNDEQLTILELPTDRGRLDTVVPPPLRSNPRPRSRRSDQSSAPAPEHPSAVAVHDVDALGVRTDLVTACRIALGIGSTTAYALAGRGELPFPAYRVGRQWIVPTAGLRAFLGLTTLESTAPVTS